MCTVGTCGFQGWAMSEMPAAQKRGSSSDPGIWPRNSGANSPCTVETWTPTFSKTRPFMRLMTPPPPGAPVWSLRCHGLRAQRPGNVASGKNGPRASSSRSSKAAHMRSRSAANQAGASALRRSMSAEAVTGHMFLPPPMREVESPRQRRPGGGWQRRVFRKGLASPLTRRTFGALDLSHQGRGEGARLAQCLTEDHGAGDGDVERTQARLHRHDDAGVGGSMHFVGNAGRFPSEQDHVAWRVSKIRIGQGAFGGRHDEAAPLPPAPLLEHPPGRMPHNLHAVEVIEAGASEISVGDIEAGWFDDVDYNAEAGGEPQKSAG